MESTQTTLNHYIPSPPSLESEIERYCITIPLCEIPSPERSREIAQKYAFKNVPVSYPDLIYLLHTRVSDQEGSVRAIPRCLLKRTLHKRRDQLLRFGKNYNFDCFYTLLKMRVDNLPLLLCDYHQVKNCSSCNSRDHEELKSCIENRNPSKFNSSKALLYSSLKQTNWKLIAELLLDSTKMERDIVIGKIIKREDHLAISSISKFIPITGRYVIKSRCCSVETHKLLVSLCKEQPSPSKKSCKKGEHLISFASS